MLKKLILYLDRTWRRIDGAASAPISTSAHLPAGQAPARPSAPRILAALRSNEMITAKRQLREWGIGLTRERLPSGECWVIGGYFFFFEFQWPTVQALEDGVALLTSPKIYIGRQAFWSAASLELWEAGQKEKLRRRLPGVLQLYNPQVYLIWARLLASDGHALEAGKYFLFSGLYDNDESEFVLKFKRTLAQARPNELIGRMPHPCRTKRARRQFPPKVYEDLQTVPCPAWLKVRPPQLRL